MNIITSFQGTVFLTSVLILIADMTTILTVTFVKILKSTFYIHLNYNILTKTGLIISSDNKIERTGYKSI